MLDKKLVLIKAKLVKYFGPRCEKIQTKTKKYCGADKKEFKKSFKNLTGLLNGDSHNGSHGHSRQQENALHVVGLLYR
jgi:hypothetical protein